MSKRVTGRRPIVPRKKITLASSQKRVTGTNKKNKKKQNEKGELRSKDVSVRQSDASRVVVYGRMRIGGTFTFLDTGGSDPSAASLTTGDGNSQIVWTARTPGAAGNDVTIRILVSGTNGSIIVSVVGTAITVQVKSTSGTAESTANQIISAVQASGAADALVRVNKGTGDGTSVAQQEAVTNLSGGGGIWLHAVHTLCWHEINSLDYVIIDGEVVTFGGSPDPRWATGRFEDRVFVAFNNGSDSQVAIPDLIAQLPTKWTSNDRQAGCAHAYVICKFKDSVFPNGFPEIAFDISGKKCFDPRDGAQSSADPSTWTFTTNAALIWADYMCNTRFGLGLDYATKINETDLIAAANVCDETVVLQAGSEPRYTINTSFEVSEDPKNILEDMADAMCGTICEIEGRWSVFPGTWRSPVMAITLSHVRSPITIRTRCPMSDSFNGVKGMFNNAASKFDHTDFPAVTNATYLTQDASVRQWLDIDFGMVTSGATCQRISKIKLERIRQGITVEFTGSIELYKVRVGENVTLTIDDLGWSAKAFEVAEIRLEVSGDSGEPKIETYIVLEETSEACFDWNDGEETTIDTAPNTTLKDPFDVSAPTDLLLESGTDQLYKRLDGTIFSRLKVSWTAADDVFVTDGGSYRIEYKLSSVGTWSQAALLDGSFTHAWILDVQDGQQYDVRVRAENSLGGVSDWLTESSYTVIGKSEPPSDVTGFSATVSDLGINFTWAAISDIDVKDYEIRSGAVWASGTVVGRTDSSAGVTAMLYEYRTAGVSSYLIKARDTTGNYSNAAASVSVTILGPNPIQAFTPQVIGNNVLLDWVDGIASTLTVNEYNVYKGDVEATAEKIGTVFGTFHTYIETFGGTFTYWIEAVDVGGNVSSRVSATATVTPTSDFYINADQTLIEDVTAKYFAVEVDDVIYAPLGIVSPTVPFPYNPAPYYETWTDHFNGNGWTDIQDAIDAGYAAYLQPSSAPSFPSYIEFTYDFAVTFGSSFIDFSWVETVLGTGGAGLVVVPSIRVSADNSTWTEYEGTRQVFAENFRYVKFILEIEALDIFSVSGFSDFRAVLSLQRDEETQLITALSTNTGGTVVTFTKNFIDVEDIQVSANSATAAIVVYDYDFSVVPAATTMKVLAFNTSGTRITKDVTCRIRGAISSG